MDILPDRIHSIAVNIIGQIMRSGFPAAAGSATGTFSRMIRRVHVGVVSLLILFCIFSCERPTVQATPPYSYPGMALISAENASVYLGSDLSSAKNDEKPMVQASFTYDFFIDTVEITLGRYREITGTQPPEYDTVSVADTNIPVRYVSWYDAVLFCNARSNREGLDTVYVYRTLETTGLGVVTGLSGLRIDYSSNGFRLPTEAEWIFAARGSSQERFIWGNDEDTGLAADYAWFADNALGSAHPVARLLPSGNGLYDMAGNAAEWVNDSKARFEELPLTDFAGGTESTLSLKLFKGGSYKHTIAQLGVAVRSDNYPVDAVSRNAYTGFRCAAGGIDHPAFLTPGSGTLQDQPVSIAATSLLPITGTNRAKLTFVNVLSRENRILCWIDYTVTPPGLHMFTDSTNVIAPVISPDGRFVAWCTRDEGFAGNSSVYIRELDESSTVKRLPETTAFLPRWHVAPGTRDTFVIYVTSAQSNDLAEWSSLPTKKIRFSDGGFTGDPEIVVSTGAYHGGMSADETYLATGYPRLKMRNLVSGDEKTLFHAPYNGKQGSDTSQVCNVSIVTDTSVNDRVLFLDFGSGRDTSTLTQTVYRSHEYLFMADFSGTVLDWYRVPEPFASWNHAEWSPRAGYAVAAALDESEYQRTIFCIDLTSGTSTPLVEGTDLAHPYLWLPPGDDPVPPREMFDSLGHYDDPHLSYAQLLLAEKMRLFWHFAADRDVIFLGSSVVNDGIDPREFDRLLGYNFGLRAGGYATAKLLLTDYVLNHCGNCKAVGLSVDPQLLFFDNTTIELYTSFTQSKGYVYDRSHDFWKAGLPPGFHAMINGVIDPYESIKIDAIDSLGLGPFNCTGWGEGPPPVNSTLDATTDSDVYRNNRAMLQEIYAACSTAGVELLLVNFPVRGGYDSTEAYGPEGPSQATAAQVFEDIAEDTARFAHVHFYDANLFGKHDYTYYEFFDALHLCYTGARKLSRRVDSLFQEIIDGAEGD